MDYRVYRADIRFWMIVILLSCAVGGSAGYLFFDAWWGCLLIPICIPVVQKRLRQGCLQKQTRQLKTEFREVMTLVSGSISAGYSLENAFVQTYRTSAEEFPLMEAELQILTNGIACHKRIEQLLMALADRSGVDEIRELAAMIEAAKRYGGNIPYLIRRMVRQMQESELVELEIRRTHYAVCSIWNCVVSAYDKCVLYAGALHHCDRETLDGRLVGGHWFVRVVD